MLDLWELNQLVAFADCGTLSRAAEALHLSQPTITRAMQHVEQEFGVELFARSKNKIALNETGLQAVQQARTILAAAENAVRQVRNFDARLHTIAVESCAPAPLWTLLPALSSAFPTQTLNSKQTACEQIVEDVKAGVCEVGILPCAVSEKDLVCVPFLKENLCVCLPKENPLASRSSVALADLNGFNCLLRPEIGIWYDLCRKNMPASRFIIHDDESDFVELVRNSSLLCFITNLSVGVSDALLGRSVVPITDNEANVTFHLICPKGTACRKAIESLWLRDEKI